MGESRERGRIVKGWSPPERPGPVEMQGRYARLERLDPARHGGDLYRAKRGADAIWDYLPYGPFERESDYRAWAEGVARGTDPVFYAIQDLESGQWSGVVSYLRIAPEAGSIEVGHINLAPELQRSRAATEAMYVMMSWAFAAGYRRYEWKCYALNRPSRRVAQRLGLSFEGIFRQTTVVKGRNRDTAWFAAIDGDWPTLQAAFERWLAPENFDAGGAQVARLSALTVPVLVARDPLFGQG